MAHCDAQPSRGDQDPFAAHFHRDPLPGAGVRVLAFSGGDPDRAERIALELVGRLAERNRPAEYRVLNEHAAHAAALEEGLEKTVFPLVLITSAADPWSGAHLDPLKCDHVIGRRSVALKARVRRWIAARWPHLIYGVPVVDIYSPCRLHRREPLAAIPLQSRSAFVGLEILAKATFLGQLIDEVGVPPLEAVPLAVARADAHELFRQPRFLHESIPAENPQCDPERPNRPDGEDGESAGDRDETSALQDDQPERRD
jgi:hypothetical protein